MYGHRKMRRRVRVAAPPDPLLFAALADRWRLNTAYMSKDADVRAEPHFGRLVAMGPAAVPRILMAYASGPSEVRWDLVLERIVGVNPVPCVFQENPQARRSTWLDWGLEKFGVEAEVAA